MTTTTPEDRLAATVGDLKRYALAVVAASVVTQLVIVVTGSHIGLLAGGLTGVIAVGYAIYLLRSRGTLGRVRFGLLAAHVITFAAVNAGYLLHFFALAATGNPAVEAPGGDDFVIDPGWFGAAISMPAFWLLGLLAHALGAIAGRGFEAPR